MGSKSGCQVNREIQSVRTPSQLSQRHGQDARAAKCNSSLAEQSYPAEPAIDARQSATPSPALWMGPRGARIRASVADAARRSPSHPVGARIACARRTGARRRLWYGVGHVRCCADCRSSRSGARHRSIRPDDRSRPSAPRKRSLRTAALHGWMRKGWTCLQPASTSRCAPLGSCICPTRSRRCVSCGGSCAPVLAWLLRCGRTLALRLVGVVSDHRCRGRQRGMPTLLSSRPAARVGRLVHRCGIRSRRTSTHRDCVDLQRCRTSVRCGVCGWPCRAGLVTL